MKYWKTFRPKDILDPSFLFQQNNHTLQIKVFYLLKFKLYLCLQSRDLSLISMTKITQYMIPAFNSLLFNIFL